MSKSNYSMKLGTMQLNGPYHSKRLGEMLKRLSSPGGLIVEYHILRNLREQGFNLDPITDNKSVYSPEKLFKSLEKYGLRPSWEPDDSALEQAIRVAFRVFGGHGQLKPINDYQELVNAVKLEKSSGAPEFISKGEAVERDYERMVRIRDKSKAPDPCVSYHRVQHGDMPKTRLVWGYPLSMTLLEAQFARPLINWFLVNRLPLAFGLHRHELAARLVRLENSGVSFCLDYSGFDSSVHPKLIVIAFQILRTHFERLDDASWDSIMHYFIHTRIIMPDGLVYKKHQGIPSGSYFTQLIGSIVNFIALQYLSFRVNTTPIYEDKILVLGDDSVFSLPKFLPLALIGKILFEINLKVNVNKSKVVTDGRLEFLGHTWDRGLVNRKVEEIAKRMAFPEKPILMEPRLRIVTRVLAYNSDALNAHLIIVRWSRYKGNSIPAIYFRDVLNEPILGWREFLSSSDSKLLNFPKTALEQAYLGILV